MWQLTPAVSALRRMKEVNCHKYRVSPCLGKYNANYIINTENMKIKENRPYIILSGIAFNILYAVYLPVYLKQILFWETGETDSSVLKKVYCSHGGPELTSQHPCQAAHLNYPL